MCDKYNEGNKTMIEQDRPQDVGFVPLRERNLYDVLRLSSDARKEEIAARIARMEILAANGPEADAETRREEFQFLRRMLLNKDGRYVHDLAHGLYTVPGVKDFYGSPVADHYAVLGVSPKVSDEEINSASKALLKEFHPDKKRDIPETLVTRAATAINAARDALKPEKRRAYDLQAGFNLTLMDRVRRVGNSLKSFAVHNPWKTAFAAAATTLTLTVGLIGAGLHALVSMSAPERGDTARSAARYEPAGRTAIKRGERLGAEQAPAKAPSANLDEVFNQAQARAAAQKAELLARIDAALAESERRAAARPAPVQPEPSARTVQQDKPPAAVQAGLAPEEVPPLSTDFSRFIVFEDAMKALPREGVLADVPNLSVSITFNATDRREAWVDTCMVLPEHAILMNPRSHCETLADQRAAKAGGAGGRHLRR